MAQHNNLCVSCNSALTEHDFTVSNFVIEACSGIKHKNCPKTDQIFSYSLWKEQFVSTQSQYSHQSAGSCTINALETAIRLQIGEKPSISLINDVLMLASLYNSSLHTGVADVLPFVTRYKSVLKTIDWQQYNVQNIYLLVDKLNESTNSTKHDVSCIITKPPESIFVHKCYANGHYILYDSHPRPEKGLNGSHFLIFTDGDLLKSYLAILFPFIYLGRGNYGLYGDMMNQCEAHYVQIDHDKWKDMKVLKEEVINNIDCEAMHKDLSAIGFELQTQFLMNQYKTKKAQLKEKKSLFQKMGAMIFDDKNQNNNNNNTECKGTNHKEEDKKMEDEVNKNSVGNKSEQNDKKLEENDNVNNNVNAANSEKPQQNKEKNKVAVIQTENTDPVDVDTVPKINEQQDTNDDALLFDDKNQNNDSNNAECKGTNQKEEDKKTEDKVNKNNVENKSEQNDKKLEENNNVNTANSEEPQENKQELNKMENVSDSNKKLLHVDKPKEPLNQTENTESFEVDTVSKINNVRADKLKESNKAEIAALESNSDIKQMNEVMEKSKEDIGQKNDESTKNQEELQLAVAEEKANNDALTGNVAELENHAKDAVNGYFEELNKKNDGVKGVNIDEQQDTNDGTDNTQKPT